MSFDRIWHKSYPAEVPHEIEFEKITMPEVLARRGLQRTRSQRS